MKDAQTVLGHRSVSLIADTYAYLLAEQQAASVAAAAAMVPRSSVASTK